jgi:hypothetical protein
LALVGILFLIRALRRLHISIQLAKVSFSAAC